MNKKKIFFFLVFHFTYLQLIGQEDCDLKKSQDSIFVYTCKSPDIKLKSIKASFTILATTSELETCMLDIPNYTKWQYNTIDAAVLKRINPRELIYRSEIEAPWPVSNRDLVMHLKIYSEPASQVMTMSLKALPDFIPEKEDVVRMPRAEGQWIFTPVGLNKWLVQYHFIVDPGGTVPVWLINLALADGPYVTFRNLKMLLQEK